MSDKKDHIFISYSSKDAILASVLVAELEARALICWIAPRDITIGAEYDEAIIAAILDCRAMVVLVSSDSIASRHVRSEVARASAEDKPIYPVRLIDIEVAGGLQFHLELSQWIDFFPNPTTESYDRLAKAISTGTKINNITRWRNSARRWNIINIFLFLIAITLGVAALQIYSSWEKRKYDAITVLGTAQSEAENLRSEARRRAEALKRIDVSPRFTLRGGKIFLNSLQRVGFPPGSSSLRIGMSVNGGAMQQIEGPMQSRLLGIPARELKSLVFEVKTSDNIIIAILDKSNSVREATSPLVDHARNLIQRASQDDTRCEIGGCEISEELLCNAGVEAVTINRDGKSFPVPPDFCAAEWSGRYCLPAQELPFTLVPGEKIELEFRLLNGDIIRGQYLIGGIRHREEMNFFELHSSFNEKNVPPLFVGYLPPEVLVGRLFFEIGWGSCSNNGLQLAPDGSTLFAELDGRGLVPAGQDNFLEVYFSPGDAQGVPPSAETRLSTGKEVIRFAIGNSSEITHGPWSYRWDMATVLAEVRPKNQNAEVECSTDTTGRKERYFCVPKNPYAFLDVSAVEFGSQPGQVDVRVPIKFSPEDYITAKCEPWNNSCSPFIFLVPDEWIDVYSRVILNDGKKLLEKRHLRQR